MGQDSRGPQQKRILSAREAARSTMAAHAQGWHVSRGNFHFIGRSMYNCTVAALLMTVEQVPLSSVCSAAAAAAADLDSYIMRQSPRISNQLVTLNSRTFDVADNTLTPAMVTRGALQRCVALIRCSGVRVSRARLHFVRRERVLRRRCHHILYRAVD